VLGPSIDSVKGPFERVATPNEAVDRLVRLYGEATQALHGAVDRFLKEGEPPWRSTGSFACMVRRRRLCMAPSTAFLKRASRPRRRPALCSATPNCA